MFGSLLDAVESKIKQRLPFFRDGEADGSSGSKSSGVGSSTAGLAGGGGGGGASALSRTKRGGVREHVVQRAVKFLSYPSVRASPETHSKFLQSKGLTAQEIREAFARISTVQQDKEQQGQAGEEAAGALDPITNSLPPASYEEFVFRLVQQPGSDPEATSLAQAFASLIEMFKSGSLGAGYDIDDLSAMVANQIELISQRVLAFYERNQFVTTQQIVMECVEKYLMSSLHGMLFARLAAGGAEDAELAAKVRRLQRFLTIEHLDIAAHYRDDTLWSVAQQEMHNMSLHKAPRDKLLCIVKACKIIYSAMEMLSHDQPISADSLLPVLIFNIIQANPPDLCTNIAYIQYFRHPSHMRQESGYFFVSFCTAVMFIQQLNASSLSIDKDEYERGMLQAEQADGAEPQQQQQHQQPQQAQQVQLSPEERSRQQQRWLADMQFNANDFMLQSCAGGDLAAIAQLLDGHEAVGGEGAPTPAAVDINYIKRTSPGRLSALRLGDFPLSVACRMGNTDVVKFLLSRGADVNLADPTDGSTVLHRECQGHQLGKRKVFNFETIRLLVQHGADLQRLDRQENTPLDVARDSPHVAAFLKSLVAHEAERRRPSSAPATAGGDDLIELMDQWSRPLSRSSSKNDELLPYSVANMYTQPLLVIHHVKEGETLSQLAAKYGVPEATIRRLNRIESSSSSSSSAGGGGGSGNQTGNNGNGGLPAYVHIPINKRQLTTAVAKDVAIEELEDKNELIARMKSVV